MDSPTPTPQPTPAPEGQKNGKNIIIILLAVIGGIILLGWIASFVIAKVVGAGIRAAIEKGTGVKVEGDGQGGTISFTGKDGKKVVINGNDDAGSISFTGENGETATFEGGSTRLPDGFPSAFPVYGGMQIEGTGRSSANEGTLFMVTWKSTASARDVADWYGAELPKNGWVVSATTEAGGTTSYVFQESGTAEKKDTGWMSIAADEGATVVSTWITQVE